jgi:hypothetical protein
MEPETCIVLSLSLSQTNKMTSIAALLPFNQRVISLPEYVELDLFVTLDQVIGFVALVACRERKDFSIQFIEDFYVSIKSPLFGLREFIFYVKQVEGAAAYFYLNGKFPYHADGYIQQFFLGRMNELIQLSKSIIDDVESFQRAVTLLPATSVMLQYLVVK